MWLKQNINHHILVQTEQSELRSTNETGRITSLLPQTSFRIIVRRLSSGMVWMSLVRSCSARPQISHIIISLIAQTRRCLLSPHLRERSFIVGLLSWPSVLAEQVCRRFIRGNPRQNKRVLQHVATVRRSNHFPVRMYGIRSSGGKRPMLSSLEVVYRQRRLSIWRFARA